VREDGPYHIVPLRPGGSLGVKVDTHVRKWVSKLDPFQDLTFEIKKTFSGLKGTKSYPFLVEIVLCTLFRTTNAENNPLMLNFIDFHIPKQDTDLKCTQALLSNGKESLRTEEKFPFRI
jgi:hypothetical protein